jgi:hypothetical protein
VVRLLKAVLLLGGAFLLLTLGVAMGTMALILLHAMNSEA